MRWFIVILLFTSCQKMSLRGFHSNNRATGEIGGTPFYIIHGQSNTGRARVSEMSGAEAAIYDPTITNANMMNIWRFYQVGETGFNPMNPGVNTVHMGSFQNDEFGPETSLAYQLQAYQSKPRYYLKHGVGGASLAVVLAPGSDQWNILLNFCDSAIASLGITDLRLHAFIWMQGEEDVTNPTHAAAYATNLANFFTQFNNYWVGTKGMNSNYKKIIGRVQDIDAGDEAIVRAAQENYCANPANNAILIDTDSYPRRDYVHFSATGQIQFGIDIFNVVKDL